MKHHYVLLSWPVSCELQPERTLRMRPLCLSLAYVPVTINACCTSMAFSSAWHSLVLSLPSIAVTCVLKAVISTLCSIATMSSPLLYFSQFSQACGCLSVEADSPVIWFSCLPPCCSPTTFWLQWDISLSISASARLHFLTGSSFCSIKWTSVILPGNIYTVHAQACIAHKCCLVRFVCLWDGRVSRVLAVDMPHNLKWYVSRMQGKIIPVEVSICLIFF